MSLGQMRVLEIDDVKLPQSMTIARFLAHQFHLAGKNNLEQAKIEAVADTTTDLLNKFGPIICQILNDKRKIFKSTKSLENDLPDGLHIASSFISQY
ncbi:unnamed protein product [Rotaria sordida]|uniref:GST N-terminal domain-containing protein n=1 Tax=Rotaria sordida TaxID=392033 RepID=A0A819Q8S1_9BILA|nr:unnamed protein product [Rotaria sordida]